MDYLGYRKLDAYNKAQEVVKTVYVLLKKFPKEEQFALCSQHAVPQYPSPPISLKG